MIKFGLANKEDWFNEEMISDFTPYCRPLILCMQELRKVVFPDEEIWLREDRQLISRLSLSWNRQGRT